MNIAKDTIVSLDVELSTDVEIRNGSADDPESVILRILP